MEKVEQIFFFFFAEEEIKIYEYLDSINKIKRCERDKVNKELEGLNNIFNNGTIIDYETLKVLGLKNSAKYFRMLCKLYKKVYYDDKTINKSILYNPTAKDINALLINKDKVEFTTGENLSKINEVIKSKFELDDSKIGVKEENLYNIILNVFSEIYFPIKKFTKGHSYYETNLGEKYITIPEKYQILSEMLISNEILLEPGLRKITVRNKIYQILEKGTWNLKNIDTKKLLLMKNENNDMNPVSWT